MPEVNNMDRAQFAAEGIDAYVSRKDLGGYLHEGVETHICDFMTDLRHMCKRDGVEFQRAVDMSLQHFTEECEEAYLASN